MSDCMVRYGVTSFQSSSDHDDDTNAEKAALDQPDAWCSDPNDTNPSLSFVLEQSDKEVVGIITRGYLQDSVSSYVLNYALTYSETSVTTAQQTVRGCLHEGRVTLLYT